MQDESKFERVAIRLSTAEKLEIEQAAEHSQQTVSAFIRSSAMRAARDREELTTRDRLAIGALAALSRCSGSGDEVAMRAYHLADSLINVRSLSSAVVEAAVRDFDSECNAAASRSEGV